MISSVRVSCKNACGSPVRNSFMTGRAFCSKRQKICCPGAALLTNQLTPEQFTLYARGSWQEVMRALQLVPMDDGPIEVLDVFWTGEESNKDILIVPPLLLYADLMGSKMGRNIEIANTIRDNELSYLFDYL